MWVAITGGILCEGHWAGCLQAVGTEEGVGRRNNGPWSPAAVRSEHLDAERREAALGGGGRPCLRNAIDLISVKHVNQSDGENNTHNNNNNNKTLTNQAFHFTVTGEFLYWPLWVLTLATPPSGQYLDPPKAKIYPP